MPQVPTFNWQREKCYKATRWFHKIKLVCPLPCHTAKSALPTASRRRLLALFFCAWILPWMLTLCQAKLLVSKKWRFFSEAKVRPVHFSSLRKGNNEVHGPCSPVGGVIWFFAHLTVRDVSSFLKSKEHDLFALLFLSDLIAHYSHFHINDICKRTKEVSKLNITPQWFRCRNLSNPVGGEREILDALRRMSSVFFKPRIQKCASIVKPHIESHVNTWFCGWLFDLNEWCMPWPHLAG